ncbi:hypothetical protein BJ741DRAFT_715680 [Chytriomyces cf. hyalinus JEL632]|nr:hypothetical protein BJ741DRAFT_715680 [Chytriomyces cf. hyalinus JEL632]
MAQEAKAIDSTIPSWIGNEDSVGRERRADGWVLGARGGVDEVTGGTEDMASLPAIAEDFFTVIVSGRTIYVGSSFSIFLASLIAPFLADIILGVIAMALGSKGFVHIGLLATAGPVSILAHLFRVHPEGRTTKHFGIGVGVLALAAVIAAVPAALHQLLVPSSNPPISTVWPLNLKTNEVVLSDRYGRSRTNVEWCVPKDGPSQSFASGSGTAVAKFSANPNCVDGVLQKNSFPKMLQLVTPQNLLLALESSTMTSLSPKVGGFTTSGCSVAKSVLMHVGGDEFLVHTEMKSLRELPCDASDVQD